MRSRQNQKNLPVTARSLETIIRLSSANAKCRLSQSVDEEDVAAAVELMNFVLFHEIGDVADGPARGADSRGNHMGDAPRGRTVSDAPVEGTSSAGETANATANEHEDYDEYVSSEQAAVDDDLIGEISNFIGEGVCCRFDEFCQHLQTTPLYNRMGRPDQQELLRRLETNQKNQVIQVFSLII